ncbi:MAG: hypothetical protein NC483_04990 [Ruminococcus sp.]|nr:hypothetical protein [Ruminococcus sp.]
MKYFVKLIKENYKEELVDIYVDMDGVIADYDIGNLNFKSKRPVNTNIAIFKELSNMPNVTLHILSIGKKEEDFKEKNEWLNKYAPFFTIQNRHIIIKDNTKLSSKELKYNYLSGINTKTSNKIILIDDDNNILKYIKKMDSSIILYQDSSIID